MRIEADLNFRRVGITFAVYGSDAGTERLIPFDIIPRIIPAAEWSQLHLGLKQRVKALNLFIHDIYHQQNIVKAGVILGRASVSQCTVPPRNARHHRALRYLCADCRRGYRARR